MNATWGIVLGAVLALATSIVMEVVRGWLRERRVRRLFLAVLRVEVPGITSTLDRLADDHGALGCFPDCHREPAPGASGLGYDRHQTSVVLLADLRLRDEIIEFYQRLAVLAQEVNGAEQLLLAREDMRDFVERKRVEFVGRLRDLAGRGRALLPG